jgi:hypothetical protein
MTLAVASTPPSKVTDAVPERPNAFISLRWTGTRVGEDPVRHSVPLGGEAGRQALLRGDEGIDKGVVDQPLPFHLPARALDLLPHGP